MANDEDVEFADVGVFTQAMNVARQEVLRENPYSAKRRRTRRQVRAKQGNTETGAGTSSNAQFKKPFASTSKVRRRIICANDSSDDD